MRMDDVIKDVLDGTRAVWIGGRLRYNIDGELEYVMDKALYFDDKHSGITAYAEIPVPASQIIMGESKEEIVQKLQDLDDHLHDQQWINDLAACI